MLNKIKQILSEKLKSSSHDLTHTYRVYRNCLKIAESEPDITVDMNVLTVAALLHDIAMPSNVGSREEHHIYGAKIAEDLLTQYNYPQDKIERVKQCVLNHRGSKNLPRNTIEEEIVADADVMAHFDSIPSLFNLAFKELNLDLHDGTEYVKSKLERDYNKLSSRTKEILKEKYKNIVEVLFVD